MSGGADALMGHLYQQEVVAYRLLSSEAVRLLTDSGSRSCIAAFTIEGRTTDAAPVWDVRFELEDGYIDLLECKDTQITKQDRDVFYRRVRKQLADSTPCASLRVGWVTDPEKQDGRILEHLSQMARLAVDDTPADWQSPPLQVESGQTALQEALHHLCARQDDDMVPPVDEGTARALLARLRIHRHRHYDLAESVKLLATGLFASGTGKMIHDFILGDLSTRIASEGFVAYNREAFLEATGTAGLLSLTAGEQLRKIVGRHSAASPSRTLPCISWDKLPQRPTKTWPVAERLPPLDPDSSYVVTARTGDGKTVTSWQLFEARRPHFEPHHLLHFDLGSLERRDIELLLDLLCLLCGVGRTWIALDGLDEISPDEVAVWREAFSVMGRLPGLTVILTVREEVLASCDWIQQLVSSFRQVVLPQLEPDQVRSAFRDAMLGVPRSESLIECLRNPFLLWLYASVAEAAALPLESSGEVTAFHVIDQYWRRRVVAASQGLRADAGRADTAYKKRRAVAYLQKCALAGHIVVSLHEAAMDETEGIDMLVCEGVVRRHSTNAVAWSHDWLRQYAIVDRLVEAIDTASPACLATTVAGIGVESAARVAAAAAVKWIMLHPEWGPVERYLGDLHRDRPELVREALPILVEGSATNVDLRSLPDAIILEFVEAATQLRAWHFSEQIVELETHRFTGAYGQALLDAVSRFEQEVSSGV